MNRDAIAANMVDGAEVGWEERDVPEGGGVPGGEEDATGAFGHELDVNLEIGM